MAEPEAVAEPETVAEPVESAEEVEPVLSATANACALPSVRPESPLAQAPPPVKVPEDWRGPPSDPQTPRSRPRSRPETPRAEGGRKPPEMSSEIYFSAASPLLFPASGKMPTFETTSSREDAPSLRLESSLLPPPPEEEAQSPKRVQRAQSTSGRSLGRSRPFWEIAEAKKRKSEASASGGSPAARSAPAVPRLSLSKLPPLSPTKGSANGGSARGSSRSARASGQGKRTSRRRSFFGLLRSSSSGWETRGSFQRVSTASAVDPTAWPSAVEVGKRGGDTWEKEDATNGQHGRGVSAEPFLESN